MMIPLRAVCLLSVATVAGCGGERRSGAASAGDTSVVAGSDTAASAAPDTIARGDTAAVPAPAPPVARATPAKPAPKPKPADTAGSAMGPMGQANAPLRDQYHQAPLDTVVQAVYDGWKQFNLNCARCHGEDVQGTTIAPHLIVSLQPDGPINTKEVFIQVVCAGRPEKGMPSWCALGMEMGKIESIYSYVKGRSEGKIHPGRPARRQEG